jgi:hypothetical protein
MSNYITLEKEQLSLAKFNEEQKKLLKQIYELFKQGSHSDLVNFVFSEETLSKLGAEYRTKGYWINKQIRKNPLYRLVEDLETRLAINIGYLGRNPNDDLDFEENKRALEKYLNDD